MPKSLHIDLLCKEKGEKLKYKKRKAYHNNDVYSYILSKKSYLSLLWARKNGCFVEFDYIK